MKMFKINIYNKTILMSNDYILKYTIFFTIIKLKVQS